MPTYVYDCSKCRLRFDTLVRSASPRVACPKCKSRKVIKSFTACGISSGGRDAPLPPAGG